MVASGALCTLERHFQDEAQGVREAATWCVVNLLFSEAQPQPLKVTTFLPCPSHCRCCCCPSHSCQAAAHA